MLVLSRKKHEVTVAQVPVELMEQAVKEGRPIVVQCSVVETKNSSVRLGWKAEKGVSIHRKEVFQAIQRSQKKDRSRGKDAANGGWHE